MTNIFFDISGLVLHLRHSNTYSGIQRTVVNVIMETATLLGSNRVYLSYYDSAKKRYLCCCMKDIDGTILLDPRRLKSVLVSNWHSGYGFPALQAYERQSVKYRYHLTRFTFNAMISNRKFFLNRNTSIERWKKFRANNRQQPKVISHIFSNLATPDDHLILLDSSWTVPRSIPYFEAASISGLKVHVLIHDLIPIVRPDLVPIDAPLKLYDWLISTSKFATSYMANSEATRSDLEKFLEVHCIKKQISVVPLAQATVDNFIEDDLPRLFVGREPAQAYAHMIELAAISNPLRGLARLPFVLCVGNLETRKNNWRIATAWQMLRDSLPAESMPRLIFAGRSGWMNDDFDQFAKSTGNLGGYIQVVSGPSDSELAFLYRNCLFTVMASLYEGWGLPVGESLSSGKTAVISNVSSLPEVGGDLVRYCDPLSASSIMQACKDLILNPDEVAKLEARIRDANLRNWSDVASDMTTLIFASQK